MENRPVYEGTVILDVLDIAKQLYGYRPYTIHPLPERPAGVNPYKAKSGVEKRTTFQGSAIYGNKDLIGREVFLPVIIKGAGKEYHLPYSIVSLRRKKFIVKTPMVERGGTVKEMIGLDDWQISIKGFLVDPNNQFPDEQLYELSELFSLNEKVQLKCALTDLFLEDDAFIVLEEMDLPTRSGVVGVREYAYQSASDNILTLTLE